LTEKEILILDATVQTDKNSPIFRGEPAAFVVKVSLLSGRLGGEGFFW
jgi:hypothetical protein